MATRAAQRTVEVDEDDEPRFDAVRHEIGSNRVAVKIIVKKCLPAWLLLLAIQNVVVLPEYMAFAKPVADFLRIQVAGA